MQDRYELNSFNNLKIYFFFNVTQSLYLNEHLGSGSEAGDLGGDAVAAHGLPVPGELEGELLLPHAVDAVVDDQGGVAPGLAGLVEVPRVQLLGQYGQGGLGGLAYLLEALLVLREIKKGIVRYANQN